MSTQRTLILGSVAYDPKVVTIWEGFRTYFQRAGFPFDYVLFSNYERQVDWLLAGHIDVAWNSPLAWLQALHQARGAASRVWPLVMRDTDCDNWSVIVVRAGSGITSVAGLKGRTVAMGAHDSPQARLLPEGDLLAAGLQAGRDYTLLPFNVLQGLHGDHVGGERDAARALATGVADAACMHEGNYRAFIGEGLLAPMSTEVLVQVGPYDHCTMTAGPAAPGPQAEEFAQRLLSMSYNDPDLRTLFDLEGLKKWVAPRTQGYRPLAAAVSALGLLPDMGSLFPQP